MIEQNGRGSKEGPGQRNLRMGEMADDQKKRERFDEKWRLSDLVACAFERGAKELMRVIRITTSSKLLKWLRDRKVVVV